MTKFIFTILILFSVPVLAVNQDIAPEATTSISKKQQIIADEYMVVSANPLATEAGYKILQQGGTALDAAIATQMVLNIVEPQSSGIGGGGFLLYYDAITKKIHSYDGRETAPAKAHEKMFIDKFGQPLPFYTAVKSGKSVGVPSLLKMLDLAHNEHGKLEWSALFTDAINIADNGFAISSRLHMLLKKTDYPSISPAMQQLYYDPNGKPLPLGYSLHNKELSRVFKSISENGIDKFYEGKIASDIVNVAQKNGGYLQKSDLIQYEATNNPALCRKYRKYKICGMGLPSSGGFTVIQALKLLEKFDIPTYKPYSSYAIHFMLEASKLSFADRNYYIADDKFVSVPLDALLSDEYITQRAKMITNKSSGTKSKHGNINSNLANIYPDYEPESTTHISIIDQYGNAVSMTSSIENSFGSTLMVNGFLLNNQLTDFSFISNKNGKNVANRVQAGKKPRSSMAPTMVFDNNDDLIMVIGSPGGSRIIPYVLQIIIAVLDWNQPLQEAINYPHFVNMNGKTQIEDVYLSTNIGNKLQDLGHNIETRPLNSGLHGILIKNDKLYSGVDPRREGLAMGN